MKIVKKEAPQEVPVYRGEESKSVDAQREELEKNIAVMQDKLNKAEVRKEKAQWDIDSYSMAIIMMEEALESLD